MKIDGNTIGTNGVTASACDLGFPVSPQRNCAGITLERFDAAPFAATVSNNTIQQFGQNGITLTAATSASLAAKIITNQIRQPYFDVPSSHAAGNAIQSNVGTSTATGLIACIDISGNTVDGGDPAFGWDPNNTGAAIYTRARNAAQVDIPGYGGGNSASAVQTFVAGANTMTAPAAGTKVKADNTTSPTGSFANGVGACSTP